MCALIKFIMKESPEYNRIFTVGYMGISLISIFLLSVLALMLCRASVIEGLCWCIVKWTDTKDFFLH